AAFLAIGAAAPAAVTATGTLNVPGDFATIQAAIAAAAPGDTVAVGQLLLGALRVLLFAHLPEGGQPAALLAQGVVRQIAGLGAAKPPLGPQRAAITAAAEVATVNTLPAAPAASTPARLPMVVAT